jgi:hypothetical protein
MKKYLILMLSVFVIFANTMYAQQNYTGARIPDNYVKQKSATLQTSIWTGCSSCAIPENEPDIADDEEDVTNGGCNSDPNVFTDIQIGNIFCGRCNQYTKGSNPYRDTDWYRFILSEEKTLYWSGVANFSPVIYIVQPPCFGTVIASAEPLPGETGTASLTLPAGEYWFFIAPSGWDPANEGDYMVTLTDAAPAEPWCNPVDIAWLIEPADYSVACNEEQNAQSFFNWVNIPTATSSCNSIFIGKDYDLMKVNSPSEIIGPYYHTNAVFGPQAFNVTGELLYDDTNPLGCVPFYPGTFTGKIAVIDRGTCYYIAKIKNAQDAGAIGVLIVNNSTGTMGGMGIPEGEPDEISIPSMMVTYGEGNIIKSAMTGGPVEITLQRKVFDWECTVSNLPLQYQVEFTAVDGCRNMITKTAGFTTFENIPPVWDVTPTNSSEACSDNNDNLFAKWLTGFTATGTCSPVKVSNDFCGLRVEYPFTAAIKYQATWAAFGPEYFSVSGIPELAYDNGSPLCCYEIDGFTPGRIAVIDRGDCTFVNKVINAQNAGASAVIICNKIGDPYFVMAGASEDIHIPVIMISKEDGDDLKAKMAGQQLQITLFKNYTDKNWCSGIGVVFTATDACGNFTTTDAGFTITHETPVWTVEPADVTVVCDDIYQSGKLTTWLNTPKAVGCSEVTVTHDLYSLSVNSPYFVSGLYVCENASFGPQVYNVTGNLKMDESNMLGGNAFTPGFFSGKIAVIDRGTYTFAIKAKNAQDAGAVGVIICNNTDNPPSKMGGTDPSITIPAMMISKKDGELLKQYIASGYMLDVTLSQREYSIECSGLPKPIEVTFIATDMCHNQMTKTAVFTLTGNNPPVWTNEPANLTLACEGASDYDDVWNWLISFSASASDINCGDVSITNDFSQCMVNYPIEAARPLFNSWANFGPRSYMSITSDIELATDGTNSFCGGPLIGFTPGNIALIDRGGGITFVTKVRNAQNAGARAVIICNNADGLPVILGDDLTGADIVIPSIMISKTDGERLKAELNGGQRVNISMNKRGLDEGCNVHAHYSVNFVAIDGCGNTLHKTADLDIFPMFTIEKTVDNNYATEPGGVFIYTLEVTNISSGDLGIDITDDNGLNFYFYLPPGQKATAVYPETHDEPGFYTNTATATALAPNGVEVSRSASTFVIVEDVKPQVVLTKTVDPEVLCGSGDLLWTIKLENSGHEDITAWLTDEQLGLDQSVMLNAGWIYTFSGTTTYTDPIGKIVIQNTATAIVNDNDGNSETLTSTAEATVFGPTEILAATIQASEGVAGPPWDYAVSGNLTDGYEICLDPAVPFYYFDLLALTSSVPIQEVYPNAFYLDVTSVPPGFYDYWAAKGVVAGATGWQGYMWEIINGITSQFYLLSTGTDLQLIDVLEYAISGGTVYNPLKINGDYPPGDYRFIGYVFNEANCNPGEVVVKLKIRQSAKITKEPENLVVCTGESALFSVEASGETTGFQWYKDGILLPGETSSTLLINPVSTEDAGDYSVIVNGLCSSGESLKAKLGVKEVLVDPSAQQYSDPVTFTGIIHNGAWLADTYKKVTFRIGTQSMGTANLEVQGVDLIGMLTDVPLLEPDPPTGELAPGIKTVKAGFKDADGNIMGCVPETQLEILPEKAQLAYNGMEFQATASVTESKATVQLIAVINDWNDGWPGDILNACITFKILEEPGGTLVESVTLPVKRLIIPGDHSAGVVSYDFISDLGAADFKTYTVKIIADCYYFAKRAVALTVYKPVGDFITGGGHIITSDSYGTRAGEPETETNFGFHVKFNKKNTNLIGGMNLIFRRMVGDELHEFQIKSNAMSNLGVNIADPNAKTGTFTTKANLTDLTTGLSVEGNLKLIATLTDRGEPGVNNDGIGFTLWKENKKGQPSTLIYSSSWNGVKTLERELAGGNLVVHSGFNLLKVAEIITVAGNEFEGEPNLKVYPNPFSDRLRFEFVSPEAVDARIDIFDVTGRMVKTIFEQPVDGGVSYEAEFRPEAVISGMYLYRVTLGETIYNGKVVFKKE